MSDKSSGAGIKTFFSSTEFKIGRFTVGILTVISVVIIKFTGLVKIVFGCHFDVNQLIVLANILAVVTPLLITVGLTWVSYALYRKSKLNEQLNKKIKIIENSEVPDLKKDIESLKMDLKIMKNQITFTKDLKT